MVLSVLIGILFLLPHLVRMEVLNSVRDYSPFSARSSSPTTLDETFLYAAQANYSYRHHRLAYDTDAFEHRNQPMPYSVLPIEFEALLAQLFRSLNAAQIVCCFLFPALTAWLLIMLFLELDASLWWAALLALVTLVASFSLRTLQIGIEDLLLHGLHSGFIETLQASRNPNPNMTFPLFLGALLAQFAALHRQSFKYAALAGILGGLLFYSYIYYAIAWAAAIALLTLVAMVRKREHLGPSLAALLVTICVAFPFLLWVRAARNAGGYLYRSDRLGMIHSHRPNGHDSVLTAVLVLCLFLLWATWRFFTVARPMAASQHTLSGIAALVFGCAAAGGILGMNMELLTGSNLQFSHHFPHMVVQPALILLGITIILAGTDQMRKRQSSLGAGILFGAFFLLCAFTQIEAAVNSAPLHRVIPWERVLFQYLNRNSHPGDVVATTSLELAVYMPVYTQDYTLMVDGSRTSASDDEILDRYLLAEALTGASSETVAKDLGMGAVAPGRPTVPWTSYPAFFFEHSPDLASPVSLRSDVIQACLTRYRSLDPLEDLRRFRVDYLFTTTVQSPIVVRGLSWQKVLPTSDGALWKLSMQPAR